MIAVDSNLLVYAHRPDFPQFESANRVLRALADDPMTWAIPWPCVHEFLGVTTNPRVFRHPSPMEVAVRAIEALDANGNLVLLAEAEDHFVRLKEQVLAGRAVGPVVHDAKVAAICLSHGVTELWTADRDFSRFPALRVRNPLASRL